MRYRYRHTWLLITTVCVVWMTMAAVPFGVGAEEKNDQWVSKIVSVQGRVLVKRTGTTDWQSVGLNDTFYPGDTLRVAVNSRAALVLSNESMLRVDQYTTLVFNGIEENKTFLMELLEGVAYLFSRKARSLKVATPFVNGVVEGTEFCVQVDAHKASIILYEGTVLAQNPFGEVTMAKGQTVVAAAGQAPRLEIMVRPRDAVQWALYYPPILAFQPADFPVQGPDDWTAKLHRSIQFLESGDTAQAFAAIEGLDDAVDDPRFYTYRAGLQLSVGRVLNAQQDIDRALALDRQNSTALSLRAVIAVVQNRKEEALRDARLAVHIDPQSVPARLAFSYALQAAFDLHSALETVQTAVKVDPENGVALARLAELDLSTGHLDDALAAAQKAAALAPHLAHVQTVLGFAYLTQINIKNAQAAFDRAIILDSAAPLPRLGLGLAKIRNGDLKAGTAEIEIAVGLDPDNSLMRSYLGKAYFDEKREPLDERQFQMAKALDPKDPTPWFYDAIRKQTLNRPGEALLDLQKAIALNDNRAVYRSRLLLDEDLAARSAALGRIYSDLSFQEQALREGWKSLDADPANFSAHRLLADMYASRPRHEIARVSELLQSQLLQPLNLTPVPPQLAESNLLILEGAGPSSLSFNEYNPLFTRDRTAVQASAVMGEHATVGDDLTLAGLEGKFSYSVGQFHFQTDGFRENNDLDQEIYNVFAQAALTPKQNLQLEYRYKETKNGDLGLKFDPQDFSDSLRYSIDDQIARIGYRYAISANQNILASLIYASKQAKRKQDDIVGYLGPFALELHDDTNSETESYSAEVQHLYKKAKFNTVIGAGYTDQDLGGASKTSFTLGPPPTDQPYAAINGEIRQGNAYAYWQTTFWRVLNLTLGLSAEQYDKGNIEAKQLNPKLGLSWSVIPAITLRAAAFRTLTRSWATNQTIEPTQVAGFNQFFDDLAATDSSRYCGGLDYQISDKLSIGGDLTFRYLTIPIDLAGSQTLKEEKTDEKLHSVYFYYIPYSTLAISGEFFFEHYSTDTTDIEISKPKVLITQQLPITISYFDPQGWFLKARGRYVRQDIEEFLTAGGTTKDGESFFIVDAVLGYRLPKRYGTLSLGVTNLFDKGFRYYDLVFPAGSERNPTIQPQRQVLLKITVAF